MSGGLAYVYDETELFDTRCNLDMVDVESVWQEEDVKRLRHRGGVPWLSRPGSWNTIGRNRSTGR